MPTSKKSREANGINKTNTMKLTNLPPDIIRQIASHLYPNQRITPTKGRISVVSQTKPTKEVEILYRLDPKTSNLTRVLFLDLKESAAGTNLAENISKKKRPMLDFLEALYKPNEIFNYKRVSQTKPLTKPRIKMKTVNNKTLIGGGRYMSWDFNVKGRNHMPTRSTRHTNSNQIKSRSQTTKNKSTVKAFLQASKKVRNSLQPPIQSTKTIKIRNSYNHHLSREYQPPLKQSYKYRMTPNPRYGFDLPNPIKNTNNTNGSQLEKLIKRARNIDVRHNDVLSKCRNVYRMQHPNQQC